MRDGGDFSSCGPRPRLGPAGALAAVVLGQLLAAPAPATCREPLQSPDLRALDDRAVGDPVAAIRQAEALLAAGPADPWRRAQLYTILADANSTTGDDLAARRALAAGREQLARLRPSAWTEKLALRYALVEADTAQTRGDIETAFRALERWQAAAARQPLGRACLLLVRSRIASRLSRHEDAAQAGLRAYELAKASGSADAAEEAAFQLTTTFRRAGLFDQALVFADESLAIARANGHAAAESSAHYVRAQALVEAGRGAEALAAAQESRRLSTSIGDDISRAFADHQACYALLQLRRLDDAGRACGAAGATLTAASRPDIVSGTETLLARIELERGRPAAALVHADRAWGSDGSLVALDYLPLLLRTRADALARQGRDDEAYAALRQSIETAEQAQARRRSLAVALLLAQREQEQRARERDALAGKLRLAQQEARNEELSRQLAWGLLGGSALLIGLLGWLLASSRRHARALRHQEALLRRTSENSPDALVLLDRDGRVRYASRALFGDAAPPATGRPLLDGVPAEARTALQGALDALLHERTAVELDLRIAAAGGARDYELRGLPVTERGELIGATLRASDVTLRRSVERAALDLARERHERAGDDLHEGIGQELAGIALQLGAVASSYRRRRTIEVAHVDDALAQLAATIGATRDLAYRLAPVQLERGSLSGALARLALDAARRHGTAVTHRSDPEDVVLPQAVGEPLYRIVDEWLAHVVPPRHGHRAAIELVREPGGVTLTLDCAGPIEPAEADPDGISGKAMIRYLCGLLGASLRQETTRDGGLRLAVSVPARAVAAAGQDPSHGAAAGIVG